MLKAKALTVTVLCSAILILSSPSIASSRRARCCRMTHCCYQNMRCCRSGSHACCNGKHTEKGCCCKKGSCPMPKTGH
jgi:hypothetical protein